MAFNTKHNSRDARELSTSLIAIISAYCVHVCRCVRVLRDMLEDGDQEMNVRGLHRILTECPRRHLSTHHIHELCNKSDNNRPTEGGSTMHVTYHRVLVLV